MKTEILGRCGYRCDLCPAYQPNIKSMADKQKVRDGWAEYLDFHISAEEVGCVGCWNEGRHAYGSCPVRPCVIQRGIENCALCADFACDKLQSTMEFGEQLASEFPDMPETDYDLFCLPYRGKERLIRIHESRK